VWSACCDPDTPLRSSFHAGGQLLLFLMGPVSSSSGYRPMSVVPTPFWYAAGMTSLEDRKMTKCLTCCSIHAGHVGELSVSDRDRPCRAAASGPCAARDMDAPEAAKTLSTRS
jgi:hypothetical protein